MNPPRILIAGIGNIFLGDDAFGCHVAQRLAGESLPAGVEVYDFGIRGLDLTYALLDDDYQAVILIDAVARDGEPGELYVIEPEEADLHADQPPDPGQVLIDTHNMDPAKVLRLTGAMGGDLRRVLLIGCQPSACESYEEMAGGLSEPVAAAVDKAVKLARSLAARVQAELAGTQTTTSSIH